MHIFVGGAQFLWGWKNSGGVEKFIGGGVEKFIGGVRTPQKIRPWLYMWQ